MARDSGAAVCANAVGASIAAPARVATSRRVIRIVILRQPPDNVRSMGIIDAFPTAHKPHSGRDRHGGGSEIERLQDVARKRCRYGRRDATIQARFPLFPLDI